MRSPSGQARRMCGEVRGPASAFSPSGGFVLENFLLLLPWRRPRCPTIPCVLPRLIGQITSVYVNRAWIYPCLHANSSPTSTVTSNAQAWARAMPCPPPSLTRGFPAVLASRGGRANSALGPQTSAPGRAARGYPRVAALLGDARGMARAQACALPARTPRRALRRRRLRRLTACPISPAPSPSS